MWQPKEVGEVVAERRVSFRRAGRIRSVSILIGRPVKGPERHDPWWCPVRVGLPLEEFVAIAGKDSLQALILALSFLQLTLPSLARRKRGELNWLGERERLIFADTEAKMLQWESLANLIEGIGFAVAHLEGRSGVPKALINRLRRLVATSGVSRRAGRRSGRKSAR
jgi:hypothetical protein